LASSLSRRYPPPLLTKTAACHNKKDWDNSKDSQILYLILYASLLARRAPPPAACNAQKPQPLRTNDTKNPAAVAIEFSGRPCSKASGMRVSASFASATPAGHNLKPLDLVPEPVVEDGVGQENQLGIGVGR
jgi:hypothetical protein